MIYISQLGLIILILTYSINSQNYTIHRKKNQDNANYLSAALRTKMANLGNNQTQIVLGNGDNFLYYITMSIGTPVQGTSAQELNLQLDTGSNIMWVALSTAGLTSYYNSTQSSTFINRNQSGSIIYNDGGVYGTYGTQLISVENSSITNLNQTILWVYQLVNIQYPNYIAGLVGMGYTTTPNFLDLAYSTGQIKTSAFTLSLRSTESSQTSYLYYNQIPQSILKQTAYLPVVEGGFYWQIQTIGVVVGGIPMSAYAADVTVFDSGTSFFYLNTALFNQVQNQFFSNCNNAAFPPLCFCNQTNEWPTIAFLLEGIQVYIHADQYIGVINDTYCTYNFGAIGGDFIQILLGDIFFFKYDVSYSKLTNEIGFAGEISYTTKIIPAGTNIAQYVLLAIIILIIVLGILQFVWINYLVFDQEKVQRRGSNMEITKMGLNYGKQPLLGKNGS